VAFTSLRVVQASPVRLLAGGWSKSKGATEADAFVVAEINPSERLLTFKAAKVRASRLETCRKRLSFC